MSENTTTISIQVSDVLLGIIDARAVVNKTTRERLVLSDLLLANVIGSKYLHKAILSRKNRQSENVDND
jgi:hypothetical protein